MNRLLLETLVVVLVSSLSACADKSASSAGSAAPAASGAAASKTVKCSDAKATLHADPPFCVTVPAGFDTPKDDIDEEKGSWKMEKPDSGFVTVTWLLKIWKPSMYEQRKSLDFDDLKKDLDKTVVEEGTTPDKKGAFLIYKTKAGQRWIQVVSRSDKYIFECVSQDWEKEPKPIFDACKSLELP